MKVFILSDLHIGHEESQYDIMDQAIKYIRKEYKKGDSILGLGDWFHMNERGFDFCLAHPMTAKFRALADDVPTRFIPGNHDHHLEKFLNDPALGNPISPIELIKPFADNGIWYCHGHEYDPEVQDVPWLPALLARFHKKEARPRPYTGKKTPSYFKNKLLTEHYLMLVQLIYTRASLKLQKQARDEGREYKGIILGHTHLPFQHQSPELPLLLDDGDMRHSGTFVVRVDDKFDLLKWDAQRSEWLVSSSVKV